MSASGLRRGKLVSEAVTLLASDAQAATSTGEAAVKLPITGGIAFVCDLTAAADDVDDTLNLFVQTKLGADWVDVVHFTEMLGDGGAKRFVAKLTRDLAQAEFETGAALGAAAVRNLLGDEWRVRFVIVDPTGSDASFTFSVTGTPM